MFAFRWPGGRSYSAVGSTQGRYWKAVSGEGSFLAQYRVNGENGARIWLARERAQTYKSSHGPNHSYRGHSLVSGRVPDGRVWIWLPVARHPRHSSRHHIDPVFARSLVERLRFSRRRKLTHG